MGWARGVVGGLVVAGAAWVGTGTVLGTPAAWPATLVVANRNDVVNGNTSTPGTLLLRPGRDGISLREAILAANGAPGPHEITFAPQLAGLRIALTSPLPPITRARITLTGLLTASGRPDLTIDGRAGGSSGPTLFVAASSFTLRGLRFVFAPPHFSTIQIGGTIAGGAIAAPRRLARVTIADSAFLHRAGGGDGFAITVGTGAGPGAAIRDVVIERSRFSGLFLGVGVTASGRDNLIEDVVIRGNTFAEMAAPGTSGVEVAGHNGRDNAIRRTRILRNLFTGNFIGAGLNHNRDSGPPGVGLDTTTSGNVIDDTLIEGNVFTGNLEAIGMSAGVAAAPGFPPTDNTISNTRIVNNVIDRTGFQGAPGAAAVHVFDNQNGGTGNRVTGLAIVNNTISSVNDAGPWAVWLEATGGITGVSISNTIFRGRSFDEINGVPPDEVSGSIVNQPGYTGVNGNIDVDPLFVDPAAGDFRLRAGSPARAAGTPVGAPGLDRDCRTRGTPPSIGAYEGNRLPRCPERFP
jgi:hypothetical protein